jgi:5-formyltetrahydrofolate cyclo-ligase
LLLWFESNDSQRHLRVALGYCFALAPRVTRSDPPTVPVARRELRSSLRKLRRAVPPAERIATGRKIAEQVDRVFPLRAGRRIAIYASVGDELDTSELRALARRRGCEVFLPHIDDRLARRMSFRRETATLRPNWLGILEPVGGEPLGSRWFDVIFLPLMGFDSRGLRLGMGGGFYDRALAWRHTRSAWRGPQLVGLAYSFQQVPSIAPQPHDVLLDAVVTERGVIRCSSG